MNYRSLAALCAAMTAMAMPVHAEIDKTPSTACADICFATWWPKITLPVDWRQDEATSAKDNLNFLVPKDQPAGAPDVFIYASANLADEGRTLDDYVVADLTGFKGLDPAIAAEEIDPLTTADGQALRVFRFDPGRPDGRWEEAAYGEETDADNNRYVLVFVISGADRTHRDNNLGAFRGMILNYRK